MKQVLFFLLCLLIALPAMSKETPNWRYQKNIQEYDTLTLEVYMVELAAAQQREIAAKDLIAQEQAKIEAIRQQLIDLDQRIAAVMQEKYDILGITEQDVLDAESEIASIREKLQLLLGLTPDELFKRIAEITECEDRIVALRTKPVSYLWRVRDQIIELDNLLEQVKANLPDKLASYEVQLVPEKRDCLYRIAEFDNIYGDATQWPTIYRANKSLLDDSYNRYLKYVEESKYSRSEDLLFPGQVLDIPR